MTCRVPRHLFLKRHQYLRSSSVSGVLLLTRYASLVRRPRAQDLVPVVRHDFFVYLPVLGSQTARHSLYNRSHVYEKEGIRCSEGAVLDRKGFD
jgi:hypothetical protein